MSESLERLGLSGSKSLEGSLAWDVLLTNCLGHNLKLQGDDFTMGLCMKFKSVQEEEVIRFSEYGQ